MASSELSKNLRVTVPATEIDQFNSRVVEFLRNNGFTFETSASDNYLSPPDGAGHQTAFKNFKTIGCTSSVIVWSENVVRSDEFIVTIHKTAAGDDSQASRVAEALKVAVKANPPR